MPSCGVQPLVDALKTLSETSEMALWPWLGNHCRETGVGREAAVAGAAVA